MANQARHKTVREALTRAWVDVLDSADFVTTGADMPGLAVDGRLSAEATEIAQGLARKIAESYIEDRDPLPIDLTNLVDSVNER